MWITATVQFTNQGFWLAHWYVMRPLKSIFGQTLDSQKKWLYSSCLRLPVLNWQHIPRWTSTVLATAENLPFIVAWPEKPQNTDVRTLKPCCYCLVSGAQRCVRTWDHRRVKIKSPSSLTRSPSPLPKPGAGPAPGRVPPGALAKLTWPSHPATGAETPVTPWHRTPGPRLLQDVSGPGLGAVPRTAG